jgi:hypothetical protein
MAASKRGKKTEVMPPGPNPAANRPLRVSRMGKAWVVVQGLGVVSMHKRWWEAKAALAEALKRQERRAATSPRKSDAGGRAAE